MDTRKYIIHADVSDIFINCCITNNQKTAKFKYIRADEGDLNIISNNEIESGSNKMRLDVSGDERSFENVNISEDGKTLFADVLFEPHPNSEPLIVECSWNDLYTPTPHAAFNNIYLIKLVATSLDII